MHRSRKKMKCKLALSVVSFLLCLALMKTESMCTLSNFRLNTLHQSLCSGIIILGNVSYVVAKCLQCQVACGPLLVAAINALRHITFSTGTKVTCGRCNLALATKPSWVQFQQWDLSTSGSYTVVALSETSSSLLHQCQQFP